MTDSGARVDGFAAAGCLIIKLTPNPALIAFGARLLPGMTALQAECEALRVGVLAMSDIMAGQALHCSGNHLKLL